MAKLKPIEVQKFGGTDKLGDVQFEGNKHDIESVETQSKTRLEDDKGYGNAAIIRCFEFAANKEAFEANPPSKQDLFNAHHKGIEIALWKDGLKVMPQVEPRLVLDTKTMRYQIFVGAVPMKGHTLQETPRTLTELAHG